MRLIGLLVLVAMFLRGGGVAEELVVYASPDEKAVRIASLKFQLEREQNATFHQRLKRHGVTTAIRHYGRYYALVVQPITSQKVRNDLMLTLGSRYSGMFFIRKKGEVLPQKSPATSGQAAPSSQAMTPKPLLEPLDWVWLMILALASVGLIASILQRKKMFHFKKEQSRFRKDQTQMDHDIDTLQGEKHA